MGIFRPCSSGHLLAADVSKSELQLRDVISLLRNSEKDWKGQLKALRSAEALIRAAPDELDLYGGVLLQLSGDIYYVG